jgi:hypothetical protein
MEYSRRTPEEILEVRKKYTQFICYHCVDIYIYIYIYIYSFVLYICKLEMLTHKEKRLTGVGFIDPNCVFKAPAHVMPYNKWRPQMANLFRFLEKNANRILILFPYNYK